MSMDWVMKEGTQTLPIIVPALNEEKSIANTLSSFSDSVEYWCAENPGGRVIVILCDNGSTDGTRAKVFSCANTLGTDRFAIVLVDEPKRGKMNALLAGITYLKALNLNAPAVVFADAEIQWDKHTLNELWKYWGNARGKVDLVGAKIERNRTGPENIWEHLESVYYIGYGHGVQGQGVFARLVIGMTYLCDARILPRFFKIPRESGCEDLAISYLIGLSRLHVCPTARIKYTVCNSRKMFFRIKGRHVREDYRLRHWLASRIFSRLPRRKRTLLAYVRCFIQARNSLAKYAETRTIPIAIGFQRHIREIIASPKRLFAVTCLLGPIFTILKIHACFQLLFGKKKVGWVPLR